MEIKYSFIFNITGNNAPEMLVSTEGGKKSRLILRFEDRGPGKVSENRSITFLPILCT